MSEQLLKEILSELKAIRSALASPSHTTTPVEGPIRPIDPLPPRAISEQEDIFRAKLEKWENAPRAPQAAFTNQVDQPAPPTLPVALPRVRWTQEMEELIHECANAKPGSYRNSVKRLTDKLPHATPLQSIRNKLNKLGYRIRAKHITTKAYNG